MVARCRKLAHRSDDGVEHAMSKDEDLVAKVREVLEACASDRKMISFGEIETRVGAKIFAWNKVFDPIYEELRALGKPDLTSIVIYKTGNLQGYPPFFSDGGEARSKRFNPNNLKQVERWQKEVTRVFEEWGTKGKRT
jgi:hypothetical protein